MCARFWQCVSNTIHEALAFTKHLHSLLANYSTLRFWYARKLIFAVCLPFWCQVLPFWLFIFQVFLLFIPSWPWYFIPSWPSLGQESTGITAPASSRPTTKEGWESLLDTCVSHYGKDFGYIILTLTYFYKLCYINFLLTHICYSIFTLNFSKLFKSHPHEPIVVFLY